MFCLDIGALGGDARLSCPICHSEMPCLHLSYTFKAGKIKLYIYIYIYSNMWWFYIPHLSSFWIFLFFFRIFLPSLENHVRSLLFQERKTSPQFSIKLINIFPIASQTYKVYQLHPEYFWHFSIMSFC